MLLVRVFRGGRIWTAFSLRSPARWSGYGWRSPGCSPPVFLVDGTPARHEFFTGMLVYDSLTLYFRALLMFFAVALILLTRISGIPDREDGPDFYTLVLGATLGMCIMASANHLLTIFLGRRDGQRAVVCFGRHAQGAAEEQRSGAEIRSLRRRDRGHHALWHQPAGRRARLLPFADDGRPFGRADSFGPRSAAGAMVLVLGGLMVMVGLAFKLSAVPFHFWCPDVFEGASAEVNAFLSVASKAAALALLIRVAVGFGFPAPGAACRSRPRRVALASEVCQYGRQVDCPARADFACQCHPGAHARALVGAVVAEPAPRW